MWVWGGEGQRLGAAGLPPKGLVTLGVCAMPKHIKKNERKEMGWEEREGEKRRDQTQRKEAQLAL